MNEFHENQNTNNTGADNSGANGYTQNPYNAYQSQNTTTGANPNTAHTDGPYSEVNYYPPGQEPGAKKKSTAKKVFNGVVALLCVAAIGTTSIVGYNLITGGNDDDSSVVSSDKTSSKSSDSDSDSDANVQQTAANKDYPTLEQLAAPDDALSIPDIVTKVSPSVVGISCKLSNGTATGTGIVMSEDGYIVTNAHVVEDALSISVVLPDSYKTSDDEDDDSLEYTATLVGTDTQTDIAVVKIEKTGLTAAEFGKSSELQVGELAVVIGNPLGFELAGSTTVGIISALNRELTIEDRTMNLIQTDASINSGNSGGPLINAYGQVIGITSAKIASTYGEGLGFAIPIDEAIPVVNDLMEYGYVKGRPMTGITGQDISELYAKYYDIPQGFIVRAVTEGSGADKAGIEVGDIVIGINGELIESIEEFNEIKEDFQAGDTIKVSIYRDDEIKDVEVTLDESKPNTTTTQTTPSNEDTYDQDIQDFLNQFPY